MLHELPSVEQICEPTPLRGVEVEVKAEVEPAQTGKTSLDISELGSPELQARKARWAAERAAEIERLGMISAGQLIIPILGTRADELPPAA